MFVVRYFIYVGNPYFARWLDCVAFVLFFFFNDTATTEIYTLSLHDALPISRPRRQPHRSPAVDLGVAAALVRSEEHTSELQSHLNLVCRLLLEKKTNNN